MLNTVYIIYIILPHLNIMVRNPIFVEIVSFHKVANAEY